MCRFMKIILFVLFISLSVFPAAAQEEGVPALIPYPQKIEVGIGSFAFSTHTRLFRQDEGRFENEVFQLQEHIKSLTGVYLSSSAGGNGNVVEFIYKPAITHPEGYELDITPDKTSVSASSAEGAFYAVQTLVQLLPLQASEGQVSIPVLSIVDAPAFAWRGSHLDVSRHMFTLDYLKKHIDRISMYKMNKFHLHLTDDQGWRIEIKKYPKLTQQGAWRYYNGQDSVVISRSAENPDFALDPRFIVKRDGENDIYGGFYTQDDLKEIIAYAASKHVEIIPEIDMPGHMAAAIAAYPHLTDADAGWGKLFSIPINPCLDSVYIFIEDVLGEVVDLFPSQYIHIGADEVEKNTWEASGACGELMRREGITSVDGLQSYFISRVQDFVESKGKKLIAWDEALEGGVNENVNIMYWRGWVPNAPKEAAANGNPIIMSPTNPLYFDYTPDKSSIHSVYDFTVVPKNVSDAQASLIRGAQANLWTEFVPSENRADFMLFPRLIALAERVWTNQELFDSFGARLTAHYPILDRKGVNYRLPDLAGFALESVFVGKTDFYIASPLPDFNIRYSLDGGVPTTASDELVAPLPISKPTQLKFALFSPSGIRGDIYTVNYQPTTWSKAVNVKGKTLKPGLQAQFFDQRIDKTTKISGEPQQLFTVANFEVPDAITAPSYGVKFDGYIRVPTTGIYSFFLTVDDAGMLYIADKLVVDNEGPHSPLEKSGQVALNKGLHPLRLDFVEGGGGYALRLMYSVDGGETSPVPDAWLFH